MNTQKTLETLLQTVGRLEAQLATSPQKTPTDESGFLKFTDKEISKMPKNFRTLFRINGCVAHVRKRCDWRYNCSYEIRYRRDGYDITASATTIQVAKTRFLEKLQLVINKEHETSSSATPTSFNEFAMFWIENFHKRKVVEGTYNHTKRVLKNTLFNRFDKRKIKEINAKELQDVIDEYVNAGKSRTAEEVYNLLNQIFKSAVRFNLIMHNPVEMVFRKRHERKHGEALTLDEENLLLQSLAGTPYQLMFAVALFTGLRPNEFKSVKLNGDMIIAINSKRKGGVLAYKRIPIIGKLKPYLVGIDEIFWCSPDAMRQKFNKILPNHRLYDLRTTFYTHCITCGVAQSAINEMVGHTGTKLQETYTDLPDEFLLEEAKKLVW